MSVTSFPETVIRYERVGKVFEREGIRTVAVDELSFSVNRGEYLCIIGRTGCGKSTTLNLLLGLLQASSGSVSVLGQDPYRDFGALKGRLACIFQGDRLLPWRSVIDNLRLPLEILGIDEGRLKMSPLDWLQQVGLKEFAQAFPHELSGGMRQRVAIARALVSDPEIVLADEAFGHLDEVTGHQLKSDFKRLAKDNGKTVVHITHSIEEAIALADRIIVLGKHGRIFSSFQASEIVANEGGHDGLRRRIYAQIELSSERPLPVAANA